MYFNTEKQKKNYQVRENNWVKANNLKVGDKVYIKRTHPTQTKGWNNSWVVGHMFSGITAIVRGFCSDSIGIRLHDYLHYPYTVLQKVED